ncbi:MAG: hypothetical protein OXL96_27180 [Candidatus Poribacteria bacterium]|nr:hypothetical protein [Candidatus Poribacteria bacterium]
MAKTILATDQKETPDEQILGKDWAGEYQLLCTTYASDEVVLQVRPCGTETWNTARFNGQEIKFTAAGEVIDARLVRDYEYRLMTAKVGAEVVIAKHDVHG